MQRMQLQEEMQQMLAQLAHQQANMMQNRHLAPGMVLQHHEVLVL